MLNSGQIEEGKYPDPYVNLHYALWQDFGTMEFFHLDKWYLDSAALDISESVNHTKAHLLVTVLHESLHSLYPSDGHGADSIPPYQQPPFKYVNRFWSPWANTPTPRSPCVRW